MPLGLLLLYVFCSMFAVGLQNNIQYERIKFIALQNTYMNTTVSSETECCAVCSAAEDCFSVNYEFLTKICGLSRTRLRDVYKQSTNNTNYIVFGRKGKKTTRQGMRRVLKLFFYVNYRLVSTVHYAASVLRTCLNFAEAGVL